MSSLRLTWISLLGLFDVFLFIVWIYTLQYLISIYPTETLMWWLPAQLLLIPFIFFVLFLAEGFELAAATLLDKDPRAVEDVQDRMVLNELHRDPHFFFSQRQIFVVLIISLMTQLTDYEQIKVPLLDPLSGIWSKLFSLFFTTLNVLWFGQVLPKRLAVLDPKRFLKWSSYKVAGVSLWTMILGLSKIDIPALSDVFVNLAGKIGFNQTVKSAPPRPSIVYWTALRNRKVGWYTLEAVIQLDPDSGEQLVGVKGIFLAMRTEIKRSDGTVGDLTPIIALEASTPGFGVSSESLQRAASYVPQVIGTPELIIDAMYTGEFFNEELLEQQLEQILNNEIPDKLRPRHPEADCMDDGRWWSIRGEYDDDDFMIIRYRAQAKLPSPRSARSSWAVYLDLPCRRLVMSVQPPNNLRISSAECAPTFFSSGAYGHATIPSEGLNAHLTEFGSGEWNFEYPVEGTLYTFLWQLRT